MTQEVAERLEAQVATPDAVKRLETALKAFPAEQQFTEDQLTRHHFCEGLYAREYFLPAGGVAVGKTHAKENFFLLVAGEASFSSPDGTVMRVCAPYMGITTPGTKRAVFAHTDALFLTFHPNADNERDMIVLEERFITPEALPAPEAKELLE